MKRSEKKLLVIFESENLNVKTNKNKKMCYCLATRNFQML